MEGVLHFINETYFAGFAFCQILKIVVGIEAVRPIGRTGCANIKGQLPFPCCGPRDQRDRIHQTSGIIVVQYRSKGCPRIVFVYCSNIIVRFASWVQHDAIHNDIQRFKFARRQIKSRELEHCGIRLARNGVCV